MLTRDKIARSLTTSIVLLAAMLAPAWAQIPGNPVPAVSGSEQTLTGIVSDSYCKGRQLRKAQTWYSCTLKCVHEEGRDYVLVVGDQIYVLEGPRAELDKFAGGRATITGQLNNNKLTVGSVMAAKKAMSGHRS
ncbi:MAG TPA: hypothetical protein VJ731_10390 [Terriglobales bacterium]|nr:hypothetical protein [Terriglobales bacterium]